MTRLVEELQGRVNHIVKGGGEKAVERHTSRGIAKRKSSFFLDFMRRLESSMLLSDF